jgi:type I restriction enzyme S subunit
MLHDLFTRGIDITTGKLRLKYVDAPQLYKESKLGMVPGEWKGERIKVCIDPIMSNVDKHIKEYETRILLCNYMDVYTNRYLTKEISFSLGSVNPAEQQRFSLKPQDVIITKDSETPDDIAIPSVLIEKVENLICGYHLCILRAKDINKLNGEFLMLQLQLPEINKQFANKANGSTRYGLTIDSIDCNFLKVPNNINEQIEIVKRLRTIDNKLLTEQIYLHKLQQLKQGLMGDLLSGRKRVNADTAVNEDIANTPKNMII